MRREWMKWAGLAGLLLLTGGGLAYALQGSAGPGFWIPAGLGAAALAAYGFEFKREAWEFIGTRKARYGFNSVLFTLLALAAAVFVQAIASNHDFSWDLSKGKLHTLSDEGTKAVRNLGQELTVFAFFAPGDRNQARFEDLLKRLRKVNPSKFKYEFVDGNKKPLLARQYAVRNSGTSVVSTGAAPNERFESISSQTEEDLVNAILKVGSTGTKAVYVSTGHQELTIADTQARGASELKRALEAASFKVQEIQLAATPRIPDDCAALVIPGPQRDFLAPEAGILDEYAGRGGRVIVGLDPRVPLPTLTGWLRKAGILAGDEVVVDFNPLNQLFGGGPISPVIKQMDGSHPATKDLVEMGGTVVMELCRPMSQASPLPSGATGWNLLTTLASAWGYRGASPNITYTKPASGDTRGPLNLAVAVEAPGNVFSPKGDASKKGRVVAIGSSSVFSNKSITYLNNQDLVVNSVRWLSDEEKRIAIAARNEETAPLMLDRGRWLAILFSIAALCLLTLVSGLVVFLRRRRVA